METKKNLEVAKEILKGNLVILGNRLYDADKIYQRVTNYDGPCAILRDLEECIDIYRLNGYISYDLYRANVREDSRESFSEDIKDGYWVLVDLAPPDEDADEHEFLLYEGEWWELIYEG